MSRPKAYSYTRWSSAMNGDALRRQLESARRYAEEHNLEFDESASDIAVRPDRGCQSGDPLARVAEDIEAGKIDPGSYLLVESVDRLGRQSPLGALHLIIKIVQHGINIVTLQDQHIISREQLGSAPIALPLVLGVLAQMHAHYESKLKSQRIARMARAKRHLARDQKVPMSGRFAAWLKLAANPSRRYEAIPERAGVIRRVFEEAAAGLGSSQIARRLNEEGIPPFSGSSIWQKQTVSRILVSKRVIGVFQPHVRAGNKLVPDGDPIVGYFPVVVDEATFWRVQHARESRHPRRAASRSAK